jgi:hypothetical protein
MGQGGEVVGCKAGVTGPQCSISPVPRKADEVIE